MRTIVIVDDDELSRELMLLFAAEAGYQATGAESGDAEVAWLRGGGQIPDVILSDMKMPGTSGKALAREFRELCGTATVLLAMSASDAEAAELVGFDGFLMKPFTAAELGSTIEGKHAQRQANVANAHEVLSEATYKSLAMSMPADQLQALYTMCLDDAVRRIGLMRVAVTEGDADVYIRGAHAIKGGCGMVGALELASLAADMEESGLGFDGDVGPLDEFLVALARLRRILDAQAN